MLEIRIHTPNTDQGINRWVFACGAGDLSDHRSWVRIPPGPLSYVCIFRPPAHAHTRFIYAGYALALREEVQGLAFEVIKKNGLKPNDFFPAIYSVLVGSERGPRLGPYVIDVGATQVALRIREALASSSRHN